MFKDDGISWRDKRLNDKLMDSALGKQDFLIDPVIDDSPEAQAFLDARAEVEPVVIVGRERGGVIDITDIAQILGQAYTRAYTRAYLLVEGLVFPGSDNG